MNQEITVIEVFNAISRLPEEERLCVLQSMSLQGVAKILSSKEEYSKTLDKFDFYIDEWNVAKSALKNIHDDVEKQLIMKQRGEI